MIIDSTNFDLNFLSEIQNIINQRNKICVIAQFYINRIFDIVQPTNSCNAKG